jgi:hypothetical protein
MRRKLHKPAKYRALAEYIASFINAIGEDCERYPAHKVNKTSSSLFILDPALEIQIRQQVEVQGGRIYEEGQETSETASDTSNNMFYDLWLRCETYGDRQNRLRVAAAEHEESRKMHGIYAQQYHDQGSRLWQNLLSKAKPVHDDWPRHSSCFTNREVRNISYNYAFSPDNNQTVKMALYNIVDYLEKAPYGYRRSIAISYYKHLVSKVFEETGIHSPTESEGRKAPAYGLKILRDLGLNRERTWNPLMFLWLRPARQAISQKKAQLYLGRMAELFLADPLSYRLMGETLLLIWVLLTCAYQKRRCCTIVDVLKIQPRDLTLEQRAQWHGAKFTPLHVLKVARGKILLPTGLAAMLNILMDKRCKYIFQIDRSTQEGSL